MLRQAALPKGKSCLAKGGLPSFSQTFASKGLEAECSPALVKAASVV